MIKIKKRRNKKETTTPICKNNQRKIITDGKKICKWHCLYYNKRKNGCKCNSFKYITTYLGGVPS